VRSMRLLHYLDLCIEEALRGLWYYRRVVTPALAVMIVSLTVLGSFLLVAENLDRVLGRWRERGQMQVFLRQDTGIEDRRVIERELAANPAVDSFELIDQEAAARLFRRDFDELGSMLDLLDDNPLPASFAVTIAPSMRSERVLRQLSDDLASMGGVDGVQYDLEIIRRLEVGVRGLRLIGILLGGTVLLAAVITTANVIRVLVVSRGREISTMRLVGASEAIVVGRFLIEGAVQGTVSGLVALSLLYGAYSVGVSYLDRGVLGALGALHPEFLALGPILGLVAGGAACGIVGSWLAFGPGGLRAERA